MEFKEEEYIVRQSGYLRVPSSVRKTFGFVGDWPEPDVVFELENENGNDGSLLIVTYKWVVKDILEQRGK